MAREGGIAWQDLLVLQLHIFCNGSFNIGILISFLSRLSKIAQHLPGRTDNEIENTHLKKNQYPKLRWNKTFIFDSEPMNMSETEASFSTNIPQESFSIWSDGISDSSSSRSFNGISTMSGKQLPIANSSSSTNNIISEIDENQLMEDSFGSFGKPREFARVARGWQVQLKTLSLLIFSFIIVVLFKYI